MPSDKTKENFNSNNNYIIKFKVKTSLTEICFPSLCTNKEWDGTETIDLLSNSNMGITLAAGKSKGWSVFIQPNGAWGWNIGDGKKRLDYLPTTLQKVNDGQWHEISISFCFDKNVVSLHYDKRAVAVYSLSELKFSEALVTKNILFTNNRQINLKDETQEANPQISIKLIPPVSISEENKNNKKVTLMTWNIWHGGRHNGIDKGIEQVISAIKESDADITCMQETYGSGPTISDALGTIFYYRSSNLSIHSKYEIIDTFDLYKPFRFGGIRIKTEKTILDVFSLWIYQLPDNSEIFEHESVEVIIKNENETRGKEIKEILTELRNSTDFNSNIPMIIGGDFNSLSHLDWGPDMQAMHKNLVIEWPVSKSMIAFGFKDSFRERSPLPHNLGTTWSSLHPNQLQHRIDYIYYQGNLQCTNCYVKGFEDSEWTSDHAAVVATYHLDS